MAGKRFPIKFAFRKILHVGVNAAVIMGGIFWLDDTLGDRLEEALIGVGIDKLRSGDFMIKIFEYFLSILAGHPRIVVIVENFGLLSFGPEGTVAALCLFGFVHLIMIDQIGINLNNNTLILILFKLNCRIFIVRNL